LLKVELSCFFRLFIPRQEASERLPAVQQAHSKCGTLKGIGTMWLFHKIGREEHVVESVPAKNDLIASGELIDGLKNLIPRVLRHETDERVQTDNCLLIEMVKDGRRKSIGMRMFPSYRMNLRS
jgi:hypothetical protein